MIVEVETVARMCSLNGAAQDSLPVRLTIRYTAQDPYACQFVFAEDTGPVTWTFARDLLADGLARSEPPITGDVRVWLGLAPGLVWLRISSPSGTAVFALSRTDVARFVRRSYALVARGDETRHMDLDSAISRLLGGVV